MRIGRTTGLTDTGRRRRRNEDAFVCRPPLFAVADGMGGARAGEVAARLAAAALAEAGGEARGEEAVTTLIAEANRRIWERAVSDPTTAGMGTTTTAALVDEQAGTVAIGHVGDSRAYLLRGGALEQLTTDHSLVAELVQSGVLTPEQAERHPQRSAITRALGTEPTVQVESLTVQGRPGDVYLLCSDGLSTMLGDDEVAAAIEHASGDPATAAEALVTQANARGGEDNITVVLFELVEGEPEPGSGPTGPTPGEDEQPEPAEPASARRAEEIRTHGAGPGGRLASLGLIVALLVVAALALYWGISR